jgi:hypothetical protein
MAININKIKRADKGGKITKASIGNHYDAATGEKIETNIVQIEKLSWNRAEGTLVVTYSLGGKNAAGQYKRAEQYRPAKYVFSRKFTKKLWDDHDLDNSLSIAAVESMIVSDKAVISTVGRQAWGLSEIG